MTASTATPYDLLGAKPSDEDLALRLAYRARILEFKKDRLKGSKNNNITPDKFQLICRAYETLSDHNKRKHYDDKKEWVSDLPLTKYTLQQLAAEPDLVPELKKRLQNATLRQINAQDPLTGHTPLYCAARACNADAVYYLTEHGAEPDLAQKRGSSALHVSAFYGHPEMVRCMLESGADYRIKNSYGNLPESEAFDDDVKRAFIDLKKEPFVQAAADQIDWFKENIDKISHHIDEQYYRQRQTLLHCACRKGFGNLAHWLIKERSANLDIVDINLNSALHLAAYGGHELIVKFLLERGANPLLINKWGMTAEQEGIAHKTIIIKLFQAIRERDMFEMAANGVDWWFKYHFGENSPNAVNKAGASLLYVACRCGQTSVAKWLLENGADVDLQLLSDSRSTPLHGAAYHEHFATVELLLSHGADVNIKNKFGETVFENAKSNEMKQLLEKHRKNLEENKFITVHLFGDGKSSGNEPIAKIQLHCDAKYNHLIQAMPETLQKQYNRFSIARRPLIFEEGDPTIVSAVCRARYGKTKFIELPLCITAHETARYMHSGHVVSNELPAYDLRQFQAKFISKCATSSITIKGQLDKAQTFTLGNLSFTAAVNSANKDVSVEIQYIFSPEFDTFHLPECVCLFQTRYLENNNKLNEMPVVSFKNEPNARLYKWIEPSSYWFTYNTKQTRLPSIGGVYAVVRYVDIIPKALCLPPDMFIQAAIGKPFTSRHIPVHCQCLKLREHNTKDFPDIAYHGTSIGAIPSILMDGLVMPSTVVSSGLRVCPPTNHIARGVEAFGIKDFSNGIFLSPSIHYCSDPVYAVTFSDGDQRLLAVLECSVKHGEYRSFKSTVPGYVPHPDDNINAIEWRFTNPAAIEIISILFIPVIKSRLAAAKLRANKLGLDPNAVV